MIFVTVGTQLAFDRLIEAVDRWAGAAPGREVFAQTGPGEYRPRHIDFQPFVGPAECRERMSAADAVVAHAGMGTILGALELGTPLLVMPRRASLGEHRNEHQLATAARVAPMGAVAVAMDEAELVQKLDGLDGAGSPVRIGPYASDGLVGAVRAFIER